MSIQLYLVDLPIGDASYGIHVPALSWEEAEKVASKIGGKVIGSDVHTIPAVPIDQLMDFCSQQSEEPVKWKFNAREQIEAFLTIGWPEKPQEL